MTRIRVTVSNSRRRPKFDTRHGAPHTRASTASAAPTPCLQTPNVHDMSSEHDMDGTTMPAERDEDDPLPVEQQEEDDPAAKRKQRKRTYDAAYSAEYRVKKKPTPESRKKANQKSWATHGWKHAEKRRDNMRQRRAALQAEQEQQDAPNEHGANGAAVVGPDEPSGAHGDGSREGAPSAAAAAAAAVEEEEPRAGLGDTGGATESGGASGTGQSLVDHGEMAAGEGGVPNMEDGSFTSRELSPPTALNIRNEPPSGATESAESRAAGDGARGAPFADEMDVDSVAEPGNHEEHAVHEDHTVPEEGGPGGSGDDEDDDGGGALPFDDDGGGVAPMIDAGGDGGEGPPTLTEGATGSSANGPDGSATDGASVPSSPPPHAVNGAASISIGPASTAHVPTDGEDSSHPTVSQVEVAVLQGVNRVHVQEKKDLHDKLVEALVSNALLQDRNRVLEEQLQQLQQQQLDGAVQALPTDGTTQAREEEPDGPSRIADAERLRQLEAANSKLEDDLREMEELDREREAATDAQMKQHLEAYEKLRGDFKAEKQAREKDVGELQRELNESGNRHKSELASLKRQHEADLVAQETELGAKQKTIIQDQEQLIKKYKREIEELKKGRASVKAEPGRDPQPDQQRSSRVSVKAEPGRDPQPDQPRSSRSVKEEPGRGPPPDQPRSSSVSVKTEPRPDQPRSSNDASSSSAPRSNTKAEKGAAGTGKK
jgi:hypothetical protein